MDQLQAQTSLNIFRSFMRTLPDGTIEARGIVSLECYRTWLRSRKTLPSCPEKAFQRALSGHLTGVDGRVPFDEEEELAILKVLRRKTRWECFKHSDIKFGESGFRAKGFHEKAISGELSKSRPKKRAKRAIERLRKITRDNSRSSNSTLSDDDDDDIDELDDEEEGAKPVKRTKHAKSSSSDSSEEEEEEVEDETEAESVSSGQQLYPSAEGSSAAALSMKIPCFISPLSNAALSVLTMLVNNTLQVAGQGLSWIPSITALTKTVMLSRGWFGSPDIAKCEDLMRTMSAKYPGEYIFFHDYTCEKHTDRILLQNAEAERIFGLISKKHGGFKGLRTPPDELWKILRLIAEVVTMPSGKEVFCQTRMYAKENPVHVRGVLSIDDEHKIIIERGQVVNEPSVDQTASQQGPAVAGLQLLSSSASVRPFNSLNLMPPPATFRGSPSMFGGNSLTSTNKLAPFAPLNAANQNPVNAASAINHLRAGFWH